MPGLGKMFYFITLCLLFVGSCSCSKEWNYDERGSNEWPNMFVNCKGHKQSPINIFKADTYCNKTIKPLKIANIDEAILFNFTNTGKSVKGIPVSNNDLVLLSGSGLPFYLEDYELAQLHFHWGLNKYQGSEHSVNSKWYPLELHIVFKSTKNWSQLAVIGVLFEAVNNRDTPNLKSISNMAFNIANSSNPKTYTIKLSIRSLLPIDLTSFYFYEGSLTTPECTETVYWTVLAEPVEIYEEYLNSFYRNTVKHNYRNPQPLNGRVIYTNKCDLAVNYAKKLQNISFMHQVILLFIVINTVF